MSGTWIKLHDNFWENPKVLAAGEDAALLYIQGLSYCSRNLTDGHIPTPALRNLTSRKDARTLARILVREGLWTETPKGWEVHDYLKVQRSRAHVEAEREKAKERQRKARVTAASRRDFARTSDEVTPDVRVPDTEADTDTEAEQQQAHATTPIARRERLAAAAKIIGERAAQRPTVTNPERCAASVASGVIRDRHQDAFAALAANPALTPLELADVLEPPVKPRPEPANTSAYLRPVAEVVDIPSISDEERERGLAIARAIPLSRHSTNGHTT